MPYVIKGQRKGAVLRAVGAAAALLAALPGAAQANVTPLTTPIHYTDASRSTCEAPLWAWPYRNIGDSRTYALAPSGDFANSVAPGWQLHDGARIATDTARGPGLVLPAGASAVSPATCVDLDYPHLRFAHKVTGKRASGVEIKIEVTYPDNTNPVWTEVKQFDGYQGDTVAAGWRITPDVDVKPDFGGQSPGARYMALRFTAVKKAKTSAEFRVDDIYVDPYMRR
ncbi:MAG: hypothetical protein ACRDM0_01490 [Thermoleophilaceae bacterium]